MTSLLTTKHRTFRPRSRPATSRTTDSNPRGDDMARSPATGEGSVAEATTLIFPKKSAWEEAAEAKRTAKKRSSSANGTWSKTLARLVEEQHRDRKAAAIVLKLDAIEDDSDLHVTVFHVIDGLKKLGILKRASAQE